METSNPRPPAAAQVLSGIVLHFEDDLHRDTAYYALLKCGFSTATKPGCSLTIDVREGDDAITVLDIVKAAIEQDIAHLRAIEERVRSAEGPDQVAGARRSLPRGAMPDDPALSGD